MTAVMPIEELANSDREIDASMGDNEETTEDSSQIDEQLGFLDDSLWPDKKLAKHLLRMWRDRDDEMRPRLLQWRVNQLRRQGERWVGLQKSQDRAEWRIYNPPGGSKAPPTLGKAARLCRRITSQMFQDPPTPEALPGSDSDEDRTAAEFASRLLQTLGSEAGVNNVRNARRSFNKSHTFGSGFRHHYIDPYGGGQVPELMMAHPQAQSPDSPMSNRETDGLTGAEVDLPLDPAEATHRMVAAGREGFTEDETDAEAIFLPKLKQEVLTGAQVRFFPATATCIDDADLALVLCWTTLADLKNRHEEAFDDLSDDKLKKLVEWTPDGMDLSYLLPDHLTESDIHESRRKTRDSDDDRMGHSDDDDYPDHALVCTMIAYQRACYNHQDGAMIVVGGPEYILERQEWIAEQEGKRITLDIPIDQVKGYDEGEDDPYGKGTMDFLGPGDEVLANIDSTWLTHMERFSNRKVFFPITSALQEKAMNATMGTYIPINPGGEPKTEEIPQFPQDTIALRQTVVENLDDESGLQLTAQGVDSPNVQSGFHAVQVIEQVLAGLSEPRQNVADALERGWRIDLQLIRAFYTTPQQSRFLGPDQEYKLEYWMASDLGSTVDVRIMRGTFSMMTPAMKSSIAVSMQQAQVITPYELRRFTIGSTGGMVGVEDDPHWMRIQRQIAAWRKGQEESQGADPFAAVQADSLPEVAPMRLQELARAMSGTNYQKADPQWRAVLDQAYQAMLMVVYPPPPPVDANGQPLPPEAAPADIPNQPPPDLAAMPDPSNPMPNQMLPTDDGGLPPDAGLTEPPPDAGMPGVGEPRLDGVPRPPLEFTKTPDYFAEL